MSSTEDTGPPAGADLPATDDAPEKCSIELDRAYDEADDPSILTVFPADAEWPEIGTTWISVDVDHAVPVTELR